MDIAMEMGPNDTIADALKNAFGLVGDVPGITVTMKFATPYSSGTFVVTSDSDYSKFMAAYGRAQSHSGEFADKWHNVTIGPIVGPAPE